jgi:hypothetical protein
MSAGTFGQVEGLQGQQPLRLASTLWQARFLIQWGTHGHPNSWMVEKYHDQGKSING